jgi:hypothetical protein
MRYLCPCVRLLDAVVVSTRNWLHLVSGLKQVSTVGPPANDGPQIIVGYVLEYVRSQLEAGDLPNVNLPHYYFPPRLNRSAFNISQQLFSAFCFGIV